MDNSDDPLTVEEREYALGQVALLRARLESGKLDLGPVYTRGECQDCERPYPQGLYVYGQFLVCARCAVTRATCLSRSLGEVDVRGSGPPADG